MFALRVAVTIILIRSVVIARWLFVDVFIIFWYVRFILFLLVVVLGFVRLRNFLIREVLIRLFLAVILRLLGLFNVSFWDILVWLFLVIVLGVIRLVNVFIRTFFVSILVVHWLFIIWNI